MATDDRGPPSQAVSCADTCTARAMVRALASDLAPHDVDDIAQEVLCALAFHRGPPGACTGRGHAAARGAFLRRAAVRQLAEHARRCVRLQIGDRLAVDVLPPLVTPSAEDLSLAFAPLGTLRRALARLGETEPALLGVLDLATDGASTAIAAAMLGIPQGTACTRLRRARSLVRAFFQREAAACRTAGGHT